MTSSSSSVFSKTLRELTDSKIKELVNLGTVIEEQKDKFLTLLDREEDRIERLVILRDGIETCHALKAGRWSQLVLISPQDPNNPLVFPRFHENLTSFIDQARHDSSTLSTVFEEWEKTLLAYLDALSTRLVYSTLHAELTNEWLSSDCVVSTPNAFEGHTRFVEDIDQAKKLEYRHQLEEDAFSPTDIDEDEICQFLEEVFVHEPTDGGNRLDNLSAAIKLFEIKLTWPKQFNSTTLGWVIASLLASTRLSQEKREVLQVFRGSTHILNEIADVLNSRMKTLHSWSWGDSVSLDDRRQSGGNYTIVMDEDLIQAIFLQYIGIKWSVFFKKALTSFCSPGGPWLEASRTVPASDKQRRKYFCGSCETHPSVQDVRHSMHREHYFVSRLLDDETQIVDNTHDGEAIICSNGSTEHRQTLFQIMSAEIKINIGLDRGLTMLHSSFDRWNSLLPHDTICHIFSFLGVSQKWLDLFLKFLRAPLRFHDDPAGTSSRTCLLGTSSSHVLSDLFGEVVLFCLDFAVNQKTGGSHLYRSFDELWFWSPSADTVSTAWATIRRFAAVTGTQIHDADTSCNGFYDPQMVSAISNCSLPWREDFKWGPFKLSDKSQWLEIDPAVIDTHIKELRSQLERTQHCVISFVQTWNSYINTFLSKFVTPANCVGRGYVTYIYRTYLRIEREVFQNGLGASNDGDNTSPDNMIDYLKAMLHQRYGLTDIPKAYLFFPIEFGGLELRHAFASLLQMSDAIINDPSTLLDKFKEAELNEYRRPKTGKKGDKMHPATRGKFLRHNPFFSFEEYTRWREETHYGFADELVDVYQKLLESPPDVNSYYDKTGLDTILIPSNTRYSLLPCMSGVCPGLGPYWRSILKVYGKEAIERFGSLKFVDVDILPMGLLETFKEKRSTEQKR